MNFKKRVNGSWVDTPNYIHNTSTDTLTTLPVVIYPNDTTATVGLKGNMYQASGVSPATPIQPQECGDLTGNLFNLTANDFINGETLGDAKSVTLKLKPNTAYTLSTNEAEGTASSANIWFNGNASSLSGVFNDRPRTTTTDSNGKLFIAIRINKINSILSNYWLMLNKGSTPLPYEPYGIKIPISSAGQTTPIYLGEVQTTRRIKKLVLDGTEDWNMNTSGSLPFFFFPLSDVAISGTEVICTHYSNADIRQSTVEIGIGLAGNAQIRVRPDNPSSYTLNTWKEWLAQQYANGTPFTVYYTLATPKTGIVNEPLRKIGDYADSVSGISIPVTAGGDTLSVDTTVQPSEVTVNYKGWHPVADVHERENGAWT